MHPNVIPKRVRGRGSGKYHKVVRVDLVLQSGPEDSRKQSSVAEGTDRLCCLLLLAAAVGELLTTQTIIM